MVEVNGHFGSGYIGDGSVEMVSFIVLERNDAARVDVVVVEYAVDGEHFLGYGAYTFRHVFAVGFLARYLEVKLVTLVQGHNFVFETFEGSSQSGNELEG